MNGNGEKEEDRLRQLLFSRRMDALSILNLLRHMKVRDDGVNQAKKKTTS